MSWVEVILLVWGFSALIVAWCYVSSLREQSNDRDA